jgi:hypothetical protein
MARTKQTVRKTTGGNAPRKMMAAQSAFDFNDGPVNTGDVDRETIKNVRRNFFFFFFFLKTKKTSRPNSPSRR